VSGSKDLDPKVFRELSSIMMNADNRGFRWFAHAVDAVAEAAPNDLLPEFHSITFGYSLRTKCVWVNSICSTASAEIEDCAGGVRVFLAHEPCHHRGDLLNPDKSASRNLRQHVIDMFLRHLIE
jgi:hypothetical protein